MPLPGTGVTRWIELHLVTAVVVGMMVALSRRTQAPVKITGSDGHDGHQ